MRSTIIVLALVSWTAGESAAQEVASKSSVGRDVTHLFDVPDDLRVTVWAETPQLHNPTNIDIDARGRIWVTEAVNYRFFRNRPKDRLVHEAGDRVVVLEDTDGDGGCDSSRVFVQDTDLTAPLGVSVLGDDVYVACSPHLFIYRDTNGDGESDERETFLTGWGGFDHDHGLHAVVAGPGGDLYLNAGNAGPHMVRGADGWTLRSGSIYGGRGNRPGLKSDDGRVWTGGLVARIGRDGRGMRVIGHNFRNSYETFVDSFGDVWQNDNDDDGNRGCRVAWVMEGANLGYFSADGSSSWGADRRPGQSTFRAHWHQDDPGVAPAGVATGAGAPTGITVYETDDLGADRRGLLLSCDSGRNTVYAFRTAVDGAGFRYEEVPFLTAKTGSQGGPGLPKPGWFRPADVAVGIDGAVYVADWYDPGVGGHGMGDRKGVGRIYRVTRRGAPHTPRHLDLGSPKGLLAGMRHPAPHVRHLAARALAKDAASAEVVDALLQGDAIDRGRAVWHVEDAARLASIVRGDPEVRVRTAAFRALSRRHGGPVAIAAVPDDAPAALLREVCTSLRDVPFADCRERLLALAARHDGADRMYLEALGIACDGKEEALWPHLVAKHGDHPGRWSRAFADIAWRLHPVAAIPALAIRARTSSLPRKERLRACDAIAFITHKDAADVMLQLAGEGQDDVRARAAWWLTRRSRGAWSRFGVTGFADGYDPKDAAWKSPVLRRGMLAAPVEIDVKDAVELRLVVANGGDGNSHDWADWIEPVLVGRGGERRLTTLPMQKAHAEWGRVHVDRNCNGGPLRIGGKELAFGIGTHARSDIVFRLPAGKFEKLRFRVGVDDAGTGQSGAKTSVRFLVFTKTGRGRAVALARARRMLRDGTAPSDRRAIARELAADPYGGLILIDHAARGKLDAMLKQVIGDVIFKNPDVTVRALASEHFERSQSPDEKLPPVKDLLALEGDVTRGRRLFFDERATCAKCHTHDGRGADIGPDLTAIHTKYDRPALLDAILNPSAAISFGYETWMMRTKDGHVHTGFVLAESGTIVMKDVEGRKRIFPASDVVQRTRQKLSTMPDNVALGLKAQEVMDLVAFLKSPPAPEPVYGETIDLFNGRDMTGWTHHLVRPGLKMEDVWSVRDGMIVCRGRPAGYIRTEADYTNYELTLEWSFDPAKGAGNSGVLLRMVGRDKVWPKSIEAQLMSRNAGDIWNIDRFPMEVVPERTRGRRTIKMSPTNELPLGGWNRYRIVMNRGKLVLEVNGEVQNVAWGCEEVPGKICLQSEGAEIRFRNIRLRPIVD